MWDSAITRGENSSAFRIGVHQGLCPEIQSGISEDSSYKEKNEDDFFFFFQNCLVRQRNFVVSLYLPHLCLQVDRNVCAVFEDKQINTLMNISTCESSFNTDVSLKSDAEHEGAQQLWW